MKIRMSFGVIKTVIIAVVFAGVLAVIGLDIALLAGVSGSYSPAIPAVSLAAGVLIGIACLLLIFNSYYKFRQNDFIIVLGFFADKIPYDDVVFLKQNIATNDLYVIVREKSAMGTQIALKVNIAGSKIDRFLGELRAHIPNVTVELFSQPKKKKKDKDK